MKRVFILAILLGAMARLAFAQQPTDQYWKQLYSAREGQCGESLVNLAKQLDDAKRQIGDLQNQLRDKDATEKGKVQEGG